MTDPCGKNCKGQRRNGDCGGPGAWNGPCADPTCAGCYGPGLDHSDCPTPCEACDGSGTVHCDACDGDGNNLATADGGSCRRCKGHGEVPCSDCDGTGEER